MDQVALAAVQLGGAFLAKLISGQHTARLIAC